MEFLKNLSVAKKIWSGFSCMFVLVACASLVGIFLTSNISTTTVDIVDKKATLVDDSKSYALKLEKIISGVHNFISTIDNLDERSVVLIASVEQLQAGFLDFKSKVQSKDQHNLVDQVLVHFSEFTEKMAALKKIHQEKSKLMFYHGKKVYGITDFLYFLDFKRNAWFSDLSLTIDFDTKFAGNLEYERSDFSQWYAKFMLDDDDFLELLEGYDESYANLYVMANMMNEVSGQEKKNLYEQGESTYAYTLSGLLKEMSNYISPVYVDLEHRETEAVLELQKLAISLTSLLNELSESVVAEMYFAKNAVGQQSRTAFQILSLTMVLGMVLALVVGFTLVRSIVKPLRLAVDAAGRLAQGDLTGQTIVSSTDEFGELTKAMNQLSNDLNSSMKDIQVATHNVALSSDVLIESGEDFTRQSHLQMDEIESIVVLIESLVGFTHQMSGTVEEGTLLVNETIDQSKFGGQVVGETIHAIEMINSELEDSVQEIQNMREVSKGISTITEVIVAIADQTSMLALNAAIEAARAGENGKGFSIVADEVRSLASKTRNSIDGITEATNKLAACVETSVSKILTCQSHAQHHSENAQGARVALESITKAITSLSEHNSQIEISSQSQLQISTQTNTSVEVVNGACHQTVDRADEMLAQCTVLTDTLKNLEGVLARFKTE